MKRAILRLTHEILTNTLINANLGLPQDIRVLGAEYDPKTARTDLIIESSIFYDTQEGEFPPIFEPTKGKK